MKTKRLRGIFFFVLLLAAACGASRLQLHKSPQEWLRKPTLDEVVPAEVLEEYLRLDLRPTRVRTIRHGYRMVRINTAAGLDAANIQIYGSRNTKLLYFHGRVTRADGRQIEFDESDLFRMELRRSLGQRSKSSWLEVLAAPGAAAGSVVEWAFAVQEPYVAPFNDIVVTPGMPTRVTNIVVTVPSWLVLKTETRDAVKVYDRRLGKYQRIGWQIGALRGERDRRFRPVSAKTAPYVRYRITQVFGTLLNPVMGERGRLGAAIRRQVSGFPQVLQLPASPRTAAEHVWSWVSDRMTAQADRGVIDLDAVGVRGLLARGTGRPDERALVALVALLKAGRQVELLLVPGEADLDATEAFLSGSGLNNHWVVLVDEEAGVYIDPRCSGCEVGPLGLFAHQGRGAIRLSALTSSLPGLKVWRTPELAAEDRIVQNLLRLQMQNGVVTVESAVLRLPRLYGQSLAWTLREHPQSEAWRRRWLHRTYFDAFAGGEVQPVEVVGSTTMLTLLGGRLLGSPVIRMGDETAFATADLFGRRWLTSSVDDYEEGALVFNARRGFDDSVEVSFETNLIVRTATASMRMAGPAGASFVRTVDVASNMVRVSERLTVPQRTLPAQKVPAWKSFVDSVQDIRRLPIVIGPRGQAATPAVGSSSPGAARGVEAVKRPPGAPRVPPAAR